MEDMDATLESWAQGVSANASYNQHGKERRQRQKAQVQRAAAVQG